MPMNLPWIRLSSLTRFNHSVSDLRLDSSRIRLASNLAGSGAEEGNVLKLVSFTFQPVFFRRSSLLDKLDKLAILLGSPVERCLTLCISLSQSKCVWVLSSGFHWAAFNT